MGFLNIGGVSQNEAKILAYLAAYYKVLWINEKNKTDAMPGLEDEDIKLAIQIQLSNSVSDLSSLENHETEISKLYYRTLGLASKIGMERLQQMADSSTKDVHTNEENIIPSEKNPKTFGPKSKNNKTNSQKKK